MKTKLCIIIMVAIMVAVLCTGCMSSSLVTNTPDASASGGYRVFALASDFPADIAIPDIAGMRGAAFVVSTTDPSAVIAINIDADPMVVSGTFAGLSVPAGSGIPARLIITAIDQGFLLTSLAVISFNPESGAVYDQASVVAELDIGDGLQNSNGTAAESTLEPRYPGGIALVGARLFVSSANYIHTSTPAVAAPGTVQAFDVAANGSLTRTGHVITSGYNPTGLANRNDSELIAVNSGVIDIVDAAGAPQTDASIDMIDPNGLTVKATIPAGLAALSPYGMAITLDGSRGFVGSAAYGEVYEVDLINRRMLRGTNNPIVVTDGSDYISAVALSMNDSDLFATSFEESSAIPIDLAQTPYALGGPFVVGFPAGVTDENPTGANTGAGPLAVRPGSRGIDYEGEDLFVLTGFPGTLVAIDTGAPAQAYVSDTDDAAGDDTPTPDPPSGADGDPCQGFAQAVQSVTYGGGAGFGQSLMDDIVLGPPRGNGAGSGGLHVVSLGSAGEIVLDLGNCPVVDGVGVDFIVFENAFYIAGDETAPYAELATVGVSEDGVTFTDFACVSAAYPYTGCAGWHAVYSHPDNGIDPFDPDAAGGDAFDLTGIGVAKARYIRIVDDGDSGAVGTTAGFDLDAVAVVNGEIVN
jgi:hypothetical protein